MSWLSHSWHKVTHGFSHFIGDVAEGVMNVASYAADPFDTGYGKHLRELGDKAKGASEKYGPGIIESAGVNALLSGPNKGGGAATAAAQGGEAAAEAGKDVAGAQISGGTAFGKAFGAENIGVDTSGALHAYDMAHGGIDLGALSASQVAQHAANAINVANNAGGYLSSGTISHMVDAKQAAQDAAAAFDQGRYGDYLFNKASQGISSAEASVGSGLDNFIDNPLQSVSDLANNKGVQKTFQMLSGAGQQPQMPQGTTTTTTRQGLLTSDFNAMSPANPVKEMAQSFIKETFSQLHGGDTPQTGNSVIDDALKFNPTSFTAQVKEAIEGSRSFNGGAGPVQDSLGRVREGENEREQQLYSAGHRGTPPVIDALYNRVNNQQGGAITTGALRPDVLMALSEAQQEVDKKKAQPLDLKLK